MRALRGPKVVALLTLTACGGGSGSLTPTPPQPPPFTSVPQVQVSVPQSFTPGCDGVSSTGTLYLDTAVEPYLVVNPANPMNFIAAWQQNRWSDGGSQGLGLAASFDAGQTWTQTHAPFSRCTGGGSGNAGDFARATDPWLAASPGGAIYALSLSFTGETLTPGSATAMLVSQSFDGGVTWSLPIALINDGAQVANDKGSITADPDNAAFAYAVWDRLTSQTAGPSYFAMTADGGLSWQPARNIYDPGAASQTIGNQIVVLPSGALLNVFTQIDTGAGGAVSASLRAMQSIDKGTTWTVPVVISTLQAVGTSNPMTNAAVRDGSGLASVSQGPTGIVYVAWQDSRFSGGNHDGIALSQSSDGGVTWSVPVQVNANAAVQAFTPSVDARSASVLAVTYYDLRNNTFTGLFLADCWMVVSSDGGQTFQESHLSGPFDLNLAPNSQGLFLGDYQSLANANGTFLPFYVQPDVAGTVHTDAFISFPTAGATATAFQAQPAAVGVTLTPEARERVMQRLRLTQQQRLHAR